MRIRSSIGVNYFARGAALLRERLFPSGCACCKSALLLAEEAWYGLCGPCRERLEAIRAGQGKRCAICGRPLVSETETCMDCRRSPPSAFDRALAVFPYHGDCQKTLAAYKFGGVRSLGRFFADTLLAAREVLSERSVVWVPVPPRPGKLRKSGWDQVEFLARILEARRLPVSRCLRRLRSERQKALGREGRLENLQGKILLKTGKRPPETALVFDDVFTTGATLNACARALKDSGAQTVFGICLFHS